MDRSSDESKEKFSISKVSVTADPWGQTTIIIERGRTRTPKERRSYYRPSDLMVERAFQLIRATRRLGRKFEEKRND